VARNIFSNNRLCMNNVVFFSTTREEVDFRIIYVIAQILYVDCHNTKVSTFWNVAPYSPYKNQRFGRTYHLHLQGRKSTEHENSVLEGG
jgi:hypothetical protein